MANTEITISKLPISVPAELEQGDVEYKAKYAALTGKKPSPQEAYQNFLTTFGSYEGQESYINNELDAERTSDIDYLLGSFQQAIDAGNKDEAIRTFDLYQKLANAPLTPREEFNFATKFIDEAHQNYLDIEFQKDLPKIEAALAKDFTYNLFREAIPLIDKDATFFEEFSLLPPAVTMGDVLYSSDLDVSSLTPDDAYLALQQHIENTVGLPESEQKQRVKDFLNAVTNSRVNSAVARDMLERATVRSPKTAQQEAVDYLMVASNMLDAFSLGSATVGKLTAKKALLKTTSANSLAAVEASAGSADNVAIKIAQLAKNNDELLQKYAGDDLPNIGTDSIINPDLNFTDELLLPEQARIALDNNLSAADADVLATGDTSLLFNKQVTDEVATILSPEQEAEMVSDYTQKLQKTLKLGEDAVANVGIEKYGEGSSVLALKYTISNGATPFQTKELAEQVVKENSLNETGLVEIVEKSGGYVVNYKQPMKNDLSYLAVNTNEIAKTNFGLINRIISSSRTLADKETYINFLKGTRVNKNMMEAFEKDLDYLSSLSSREQTNLNFLINQIAKEGAGGRTWFTPRQWKTWLRQAPDNILLKNKDELDRVIEGAKTYARAENTNYVLLNASMRDELIRNNYKRVNGFGEFNGYAKVFDDVQISKNTYEEIGGQWVKASAKSAKHQEALLEKGYVRVVPKNPIQMADGKYADSFLVNKNSINVDVIKPTDEVLGYRVGGARIYDLDYKLSTTIKDGEVVLARTLFGGNNFKLGKEVEAKINMAIKYANELKDEIITREQFDDAFNQLQLERIYKNSNEFMSEIDSGKISLEHGVELVRNREKPKKYQELINQSNAFTPKEMDEGVIGVDYTDVIDRAGTFFGKRGESQLRNYEGGLQEKLSPLDALNRSIQHASKFASFNTTKIANAAKFFNTFRHIAINNKEIDSPIDFMLNAKFNKDDDLYETAENLRATLIRAYAHLTPQETLAHDAIMDWAENMMGYQGKTALSKNLAEPVAERAGTLFYKLRDADPLNALRTASFHGFMGFFSPRQLFIQSTAAVSAMSVAPQFAIQALSMSYVTGIALVMRKLNKNAFNFLNDNALIRQFTGLNSGELREFLDLIDRSKWLDTSDNMLIEGISPTNHIFGSSVGAFDVVDGKIVYAASDVNPNIAEKLYKGTINKTNKVLDAGLMFYRGAEQFNRSVALSIAYKEAKTAGKAISNIDELVLRADDLLLNMSSAGKASFQTTPLLKNATQFLSYTSRYMGTMGKALGLHSGKSGLTRAEAQRFMVGQFVLFGGAAVPLMREQIMAAYEELGIDPNLGSDLLYGGVVNTLMLHGLEADVDVAGAVGGGLQLYNVFRETISENNMLELFAGASYGLAKNGWDTGYALMHSFLGGNTKDLDHSMLLKEFINEQTSISKQIKAGLEALESGNRLTGSGDLQQTDMNFVEALGAFLGLKSTTSEIGISDFFSTQRYEKNIRPNIVKEGKAAGMKLLQAHKDGDYDQMRHWEAKIQYLVNTLAPSYDRERILNEIYNSVSITENLPKKAQVNFLKKDQETKQKFLERIEELRGR